MEDGVHVALVLLDLLFQVGQAPVAVMGHGDGAGDFALHIHLQCLSWSAPVCKQPRHMVRSMSAHITCISKLSQAIHVGSCPAHPPPVPELVCSCLQPAKTHGLQHVSPYQLHQQASPAKLSQAIQVGSGPVRPPSVPELVCSCLHPTTRCSDQLTNQRLCHIHVSDVS